MFSHEPFKAILTFHAIDHTPSVLSMFPDEFSSLLRGLARKSVIQPLSKIISQSPDLSAESGNQFALTFDDGYASVYTHALPIISALNIQATVFVTSDWVNEGRDQRRLKNGHPILNWDQLNEMSKRGFSIGCHTLSHPDLRELDSSGIRHELADAKAVLEDRLQVPVTGFAYPGGNYNQQIVSIASEIFDYACTDFLSTLGRNINKWKIPRVDTYYLQGTPGKILSDSSWLPAYLKTRNIPRRLRRWIGSRKT